MITTVLKSPASRLFTQLFIQTHVKENIKAPRHWPLCGAFTGDRWIPRTKASNAENASIWWPHHGTSGTLLIIMVTHVVYCISSHYLQKWPHTNLTYAAHDNRCISIWKPTDALHTLDMMKAASIFQHISIPPTLYWSMVIVMKLCHTVYRYAIHCEGMP